MKKTVLIISISLVLISFISFSNIAVIDGINQEKTNLEQFLKNNESSTVEDENITTEVSIDSKKTQFDSVLGWELGTTISGIDCTDFYVTGICVGLNENVAVIVESTLISEFTEVRGNNIAYDFQRKIYDPTATVYAIPEESIVYPGSHDVALIIVDTVAHSTSWTGRSSSAQLNGYVSIYVSKALDWPTIAHEYQHAMQFGIRYSTSPPLYSFARWSHEGMSELWPNFLGLTTTNRCNEGYIERLEEREGQNIPFINFAPRGHNYYGASYAMSWAFVFYMYEQFGIDFLKAIINDVNLSVVQAINHHLPLLFGYEDYSMRELIFDFQMALRLNKPEFDPKWGFDGVSMYIPTNYAGSASDLPIDLDMNIFHWAGDSQSLRVSNPDFTALKYSFNGSSSGDFDVHVIGSSFYNSTYTEEFVSHMSIDNETQDGELIFILPTKVSYVYVNVANANGPDYGFDMEDGEELNAARNSLSIQIEKYDPELVGTIESLIYEDRTFTVTASVDWNLESTLEDNDIAPHMVLYDADGEFAFNLQAYLTYDEASGKWSGELELPDDIKSGDYVVKLFVGGAELASADGIITSSSAPSFLFLTLSLSFISMVLFRRRK